MTKEFLQTRFVRSTVLIRAAVAMVVNLAKATMSRESSLGRPQMIVVAILKCRRRRSPITTETHPLDMATMKGDNSLGTIVALYHTSTYILTYG